MKFKFSLFYKELILFAATMSVALFAASRIIKSPDVVIQPAIFGYKDFIVMGIFISVLILARKSKRFLYFFYRVFLVLVILGGSQIIFSALAPFPFDIIFSIILLVLFFAYRNVFFHNLAIILGIAGIGMMVGLSLTPKAVVIVLVALSFYDIIAVYKTKHMVSMARTMIQSGAVFGFVIPSQFKGFLANSREAQGKVGDDFMILGSGDIGLPLIMVSSLSAISMTSAIITALFSISGLFLTHIIFINQGGRKPMAALPPIATMTIIGYLVTKIFTF